MWCAPLEQPTGMDGDEHMAGMMNMDGGMGGWVGRWVGAWMDGWMGGTVDWCHLVCGWMAVCMVDIGIFTSHISFEKMESQLGSQGIGICIMMKLR